MEAVLDAEFDSFMVASATYAPAVEAEAAATQACKRQDENDASLDLVAELILCCHVFSGEGVTEPSAAYHNSAFTFLSEAA